MGYSGRAARTVFCPAYLPVSDYPRIATAAESADARAFIPLARFRPMRRIACVVMPTYNEAANLAGPLPRIFDQAEKIAFGNGAGFVEPPILFGPRAHGTSKLSFSDQIEFIMLPSKLDSQVLRI